MLRVRKTAVEETQKGLIGNGVSHFFQYRVNLREECAGRKLPIGYTPALTLDFENVGSRILERSEDLRWPAVNELGSKLNGSRASRLAASKDAAADAVTRLKQHD